MNRTKAILLFSMLLVLIAMPACFAEDNNTTDIGFESPIQDYYFDAGVENDTGDGSIDHPYKTLKSSRIKDDSNIYLANGDYSLDKMASVNNVNIIGSDAEKTVISYFAVGFDLKGPLTLTNVTLVSMAIDANSENLTASNTIFKSYSSDSLSLIEANGANLNFNNCTFMDNQGKNGGAIYVTGGKMLINNSAFIKNSAEMHGGAITCEKDANVEIYNTKFADDESQGDGGGAIYSIKSSVLAYNVEINNCYAPFGGAITSLSSDLDLKNFKSRNNRAKYYGGSVYIFEHSFAIINSTLINNTADIGGALFVDGVEDFKISGNVFINNTADTGCAVYSRISDCYYDSICNPELNNTFENNTVFESDTLDITFVNDDYMMMKPNGDYSEVLPSYYNLRDLGQVSSVKNQGSGGNCWSFSAIAALESAILKSVNVTYDLSEENMKNLMSRYSSYGWTMDTNVGGYDKMAIGYLAGWLGPVNESDDGYSDKSLLSPLLDSFIHIQNILFLTRDNYTDNDAIKRAIMEYGAVSTSIFWSGSYLKNDKNYYYNGDNGANHAIAIVGWDDNYDKANFKNNPQGNGAWIIKNSWGTKKENDGFYYVSYYDTRIAQPGRYVSYAFILNNTYRYDKIYQYDVQGRTDYFINATSTVWYKTRFTATSNEYLAAVSTYFEKDTDWELSVYINGVLKATKSGKSPASYTTFDLDHLLALKEGDIFEIAFKITVDGDAGVPISEYISLNQETYGQNTSFISYDGKTWADLYDRDGKYPSDAEKPSHTYYSQVACIKAFTLFDKIRTNVSIKVIYNKLNDVSTVIANVYDEWGNAVRDGNVAFTLDGKTFTNKVTDGKASFNYLLDDNLHNISAAYSGTDYYPSSASIQFAKPTNLEATFEIADIEFGRDLMAHILVQDRFGNIILDEVSLKVNGMTYNLTVSDDRLYLIPLRLDEGFYTAEISGNDFESRKANFTVFKSSADLTLDIAASYGSVSIDMTLSNMLNETAVMNIFDKNTTVSFINGHANVRYDNLENGIYNIGVYLSDNYLNNFKNASFEISYSNTSLIVSDMATYYYSGEGLSIRLVDCNGNPLSNRLVKVTVSNKSNNLRTDNDGIASYEAYLENGVHNITVAFSGDSYYLSSRASAKIYVSTTIIPVSGLTKTYGSNYLFKLLDTYGNPLKDYTISVEVNGAEEFVESDSEGVFSLYIYENPGSYKMTITNPVNNEEMSATIKVVARITENKAVTMYYGAGKSYTVKVLDDDGNIAKGVKVTFKINGKSYTRTTDAKGYASFKLTLNPGTYTITATYKGYKVSNKVVIKPTLVMSAKTVKKSTTFKYSVKLLNSNGKILKNKKVKVKFRGKSYSAKTNSKGIANFKIKALSKTGKYTLTATYGSAKVSKKITIKK